MPSPHPFSSLAFVQSITNHIVAGASDGDWIDRLVSKVTVIILLILSTILLTTLHWGQFNCWPPAEYTESWIHFVNDYCYAHGTYFAPFDRDLPWNMEARQRIKIQYYQWVPYGLALQAICMYIPRLVWKVSCHQFGVNLEDLIQSLLLKENENCWQVEEKAVSMFTAMLKYLKEPKRKQLKILKINLFMVFASCKILQIGNILIQWYILNWLLKGPFTRFWGISVLTDLFNGRDWEDTGNFPRITHCDVPRRHAGPLKTDIVLCVLTANIYYEKVAIFLWFWLLFLVVGSFWSIIYWIWVVISYKSRLDFIKEALSCSLGDISSTQEKSGPHEFSECIKRGANQIFTPSKSAKWGIYKIGNNTDDLDVVQFVDFLGYDGIFLLKHLDTSVGKIYVGKMWSKSSLVFIWLYYIINLTSAYHFMENELTNTPEVECQGRKLSMVLSTKEPFRGKVYAKGMFEKELCSFDYSKEDLLNYKNVTKIYVTLDYNKCHTERIRTLQPSGVTYMNTLVVQFHDTFITNADKAYHVRCFYSELEKTVQSGFDVSMIPTDPLYRDLAMPSCTYSVRRGTANGPLVKSAQVGDIVYHRWDCNGNSEVYGMLVHSCLVENEKGSKSQILNAKGCSIDKHLLPDLYYNRELDLAYAESKVFKFPDNSFIHFKCQIMICTKINDECSKITPPICDYNRQARRALPFSLHSPNMDVLADQILVLEDGQQEYLHSMNSGPAHHQLTKATDYESFTFRSRPRANTMGSSFSGAKQLSSTQACTNRILMFCILVGFLVFFGTSIIFMIYLLIRNRQGQGQPGKIIDWMTTPPPISPEWGKSLDDFIVKRKSDYE